MVGGNQNLNGSSDLTSQFSAAVPENKGSGQGKGE